MFTTRSKTVCGHMEADKIIRVECLNWEAAWTLFQEKVGYKGLNSDADIQRLAKIVAKECLGLPLALITIGRSMASKNTCQEWEHAISVLKNSAAEFPGMGDNVLPLLKFSYDFLPNDIVRSCFLFCSMYSEDYSIEIRKVIEKWIGEGYISGYDNGKEAINSGHDIIGILKSACLLEKAGSGFVKMHDVIRDLALWIACECGRVKDKYYVKAGLGLFEAPQAGKWPTMAEKISLFGNRIFKLESIPKCPNLSTMLVSDNKRLQYIHNDFFLYIRSLRFLDLSRTRITKVPSSICKLFELEFLDLSFTDIKSLPYEMRNLTNLKYLSLRNQKNITTYEIPHGIIMNLSNLEFLMLDVKKSEDPKGSFEIDELKCLNNLKCLEIRFFSDSKDIVKFLNYPKLANCARKFSILTYKDITSLSLSASSASSSDVCLGHLKWLENLCIYDCSELKELKLNKEMIEFKNLERMDLMNLPKLIISWDASNLHLGAHFRKLLSLQLDGCGAMVDLTWLLLIPNLQSLWIESCNRLQEILSSSRDTTFSNLKYLRLKYLPNLQSICSMSALPFPSLKTLIVHECPKLKRLPLDLNSAKNKLKKIGARKVWWDGLEWENETFKTHFAMFLSSPF